MRAKLKPYNNQLVRALGTIDTIRKIDSDVTRITLKFVKVYQHDKRKLMKDLPLISREDHLHLFVPDNFIDNFGHFFDLEPYAKLDIVTRVSTYMRSDGSVDLGLRLIKQSKTFDRFVEICKFLPDYKNVYKRSDKEFIKFTLSHSLELAEEHLRKSKDVQQKLRSDNVYVWSCPIPYGAMMSSLSRAINRLETYIADLKSLQNSRYYRRQIALINKPQKKPVLRAVAGFA